MNKTIEELYDGIKRDEYGNIKPASIYDALTKAYSAGQKEELKWLMDFINLRLAQLATRKD